MESATIYFIIKKTLNTKLWLTPFIPRLSSAFKKLLLKKRIYGFQACESITSACRGKILVVSTR
jgi:hypothetical protein